MLNRVKAYLKSDGVFKNRQKIKEIVNHPDLTEEERWLIYYTYGEDRYIINTARKLNMSESRFHKIKDIALTKLYYILNL